MRRLIYGVHHFKTSDFPSNKELFERLAHGQNPDALFITCSDSRVDPCLLTKSRPGELFVMRNAGNMVPPFCCCHPCGAAATIDYALSVLKVKDIVVCGHRDCGLVKAALNPPPNLDQMKGLSPWVALAENVRRVLGKLEEQCCSIELLNAAIEEHVLIQLENLQTHPAVIECLASGQLTLHGWVYDIRSGDVYGYCAESNQFEKLNKPADDNAI
jgi:carbonic anhydrase